MKIVFLKDHVGFKAGDTSDDHQHAAYLVRMGVAEEVAEKKELKPKKEKKELGKNPGADK